MLTSETEINHIQQKHKCGCVPASLAMITHISYEEATSFFPDVDFNVRGVGGLEMIEFLKQHNLKYSFVKYNNMFIGNVYLVVVPSLNQLGGTHQIVIDTRQATKNDIDEWTILDPNFGKPDVKVYDSDNLQAWMEVIVIHNYENEEDKIHESLLFKE